MDEVIEREGASSQVSRIGFPCAVEAALSLGRTDEARRLLSLLADRPRGHVPPYLRAQLFRGQGLISTATGHVSEAEAHFHAAIETLKALGYPYWLARVRTDLAAVLLEDGRASEARPLLNEAIASLRQLRALPAVERVEALLASGAHAGASA
jgi:tetratricopeptide (TPR) repeat protein